MKKYRGMLLILLPILFHQKKKYIYIHAKIIKFPRKKMIRAISQDPIKACKYIPHFLIVKTDILRKYLDLHFLSV